MGYGIPDDPIIRKMERTGYGTDKYVPREEPWWESPDGDFVSDDGFADYVKQLAEDDPHWVADCLGFTRRGLM